MVYTDVHIFSKKENYHLNSKVTHIIGHLWHLDISNSSLNTMNFLHKKTNVPKVVLSLQLIIHWIFSSTHGEWSNNWITWSCLIEGISDHYVDIYLEHWENSNAPMQLDSVEIPATDGPWHAYTYVLQRWLKAAKWTRKHTSKGSLKNGKGNWARSWPEKRKQSEESGRWRCIGRTSIATHCKIINLIFMWKIPMLLHSNFFKSSSNCF
jgi:hypothetical protein